MNKNIELELRSELTLDQFEGILNKLKAETRLISQTKRLSIMFLGEINEANFDIRIRINNRKEAELVIKKGAFHAHDRMEISQKITKDQILGFVKIFSLFDFSSKITERENFLFDIGDNIELALVKAGSIAYLEIEKMSASNDLSKNKDTLVGILRDLNLKPINESSFNELCNRLSIYSDIKFTNTTEDFKKLEEMLSNY